jgi:hypothetical protein
MKRFFTLVLLAVALNSAYSQSNIPNGDFENWYNVVLSATLNYDELGTGPTDNWISTLNSLAAVPPTAGGPGPVTVFKTTDKYSGTYAAKAVSANFPLGPVSIFIPGMIGTAVMDMVGVKALLGRPCADCKPLHLKGYYKFEPVNNDSCAAVILLSRWNATAKKRDTVGYGRWVQKSPVTHYTEFDVPVNYTGTGAVDTITILVVSSANFDVVSFVGSQGEVGNTMYVDALSLEYSAGIEQALMPEVGVSLFPNPASDVLNIRLSKEIRHGSFDIYNGSGKLMGSFNASSLESTIPVYSLVNGTYYFRLKEEGKLLNTGSFVIKK